MRKKILLLSTAAVLLAAVAQGVDQGDLFDVRSVRIQAGDDRAWADPGFDDSAWLEIPFGRIDEPESILWIRGPVEIERDEGEQHRPVGLFVAALASSEIYWDGILIGRAGIPGATPDDETPGPIQIYLPVPDKLAAPGEHVIALRTSAHHRGFEARQGYWLLLAGDYETILAWPRAMTWLSLVSLSGMLMASILALVLFLTDRRDRSYLLLSLIGLASSLLLAAESWRTLVGYTYDLHIARLVTIYVLTLIVSALILLFVIVRFPGRHARAFAIFAALLFTLALFSPGWDGKSGIVSISGFTLALIWSIRALAEKRRGAGFAVAGLLFADLMIFIGPGLFSDLTLFFSIDALLLSLLAAHALQARHEREEGEKAEVRSARLEIELLRKHIQPHFLMNTLTALNEWIEESPSTASKMIELLGDEFRTLSSISHYTLVPTSTELEICRTHLAIMSLRKGKDYELETIGVDCEAMIPPAVIHTLVENAVTHERSESGTVRCTLREERIDGQRRLTFDSPLSGTEGAGGDGTGVRYIRARLQESFGDDWKMTAGPSGEAWRTELEIPHRRLTG